MELLQRCFLVCSATDLSALQLDIPPTIRLTEPRFAWAGHEETFQPESIETQAGKLKGLLLPLNGGNREEQSPAFIPCV